MSLQFERWSDGTIHTVSRDRRGRFTKPTSQIEVVDWLLKSWTNRRVRPFQPPIRKRFIANPAATERKIVFCYQRALSR